MKPSAMQKLTPRPTVSRAAAIGSLVPTRLLAARRLPATQDTAAITSGSHMVGTNGAGTGESAVGQQPLLQRLQAGVYAGVVAAIVPIIGRKASSRTRRSHQTGQDRQLTGGTGHKDGRELTVATRDGAEQQAAVGTIPMPGDWSWVTQGAPLGRTAPDARTLGQDIIVVSCYTEFDKLAHGPTGTQAAQSLRTYALDPTDGQLVLLSVSKEQVVNPAFTRFNAEKNVLYTCTETVEEKGEIHSWSLCPKSGMLNKLTKFPTTGTSTCYITLDKEHSNMLIVNYWDATIEVHGLDPKTGQVNRERSVYDPKHGKPMKARHDNHVNHSLNDETAQAERQSDPHSHAIVLDPFYGRIAFVPDLGMDLIRQFRYCQSEGTLKEAGTVPSGPPGAKALGPRYIEFHPTLPICYVVNELSCEVSVFQFDLEAAEKVVKGGEAAAGMDSPPTLKLIQTLKTVPSGFPTDMNTCGRLAVHPSGDYVLVSNRGHNSIAVFRVHHDAPIPGMLSVAGVQHTRGACPRHFQFSSCGQWLVAANQDSDNISTFYFDTTTGKLMWTGHQYSVPSPNFVCTVEPQVEDEVEH